MVAAVHSNDEASDSHSELSYEYWQEEMLLYATMEVIAKSANDGNSTDAYYDPGKKL